MTPEDDLGLDPEQLKALLQLHEMDQRQGFMNDSLSQARALRNMRAPESITKRGALIGAVTNALTGFMGGREEAQLEKRRSDLLSQETAAREPYAQALLAALARGQAHGGSANGGNGGSNQAAPGMYDYDMPGGYGVMR
jgi:hypothetical protein